jgi:hypothetical protein
MPVSESNTLTLNASGSGGCTPNKDPWRPAPGPVEILNKSGFEQTLTNVTKGVLAPAPHRIVTVPTEGWPGTAGSNKGTYIYDDGFPEAGPRTGTIDPS